jgi:release factor glutamine methyltransferase
LDPVLGSGPGSRDGMGESVNARPSISSFVRRAAGLLRGIGAGNPRLEAEYLLSRAFGLDRIDLLRRRPHEEIPEAVQAHFERLLQRRLAREPLQYVLGTVPFCELDLEIGPGALIPRSETEVLVEQVCRAVRRLEPAPDHEMQRGERETQRAERGSRRGEHESRGADRSATDLLIDVGTGSGAILLALLHRLPGFSGVGIDSSRDALVWARRNLRRVPAGRRAHLLRGNLLDPIRGGSAMLVVSNPPYIRTADIPELAEEIRDHEPFPALDGGEDGLSLVRPLLAEAARVLRPGGLFAVELAPDQPEVVRKWARAAGAFQDVVIYQDLADRPRGILARRG